MKLAACILFWSVIQSFGTFVFLIITQGDIGMWDTFFYVMGTIACISLTYLAKDDLNEVF